MMAYRIQGPDQRDSTHMVGSPRRTQVLEKLRAGLSGDTTPIIYNLQ